MAKKAVLVGCNYPNTKAELHGCVNDVKRIHKCLVERYGFNESDVTVLIDTDRHYTKPTGANIKRALDQLIVGSKPGDFLFFHFSGHGVRLPAETGSEDDTGYDECIVPCDMNLITDVDFKEFVEKLPQGVTMTLISDSCHSGGLVQDAKEQIGDSTHSSGGETKRDSGRFRDGLKMFLSGKVQDMLQDRGVDISSLHLPHNHHHRIRAEDEFFQQVPYDGEGLVKSRALPLSTLIDILKQESGNPDIDIGTIRPTLFDMFGQDSSSKVKKFMKVLFQTVHHDGGPDSSHHHKIMSALAQQFMKHKLDELDDTDAYMKPALEMQGSDVAQAYAGVGGSSQVLKDRAVFVSGCQSSETSADANPSGKAGEAYGAMSNAVQMVLSEHDGPITNHELVMKVRQILKNQGFSQRPGLYCEDGHATCVFIC